MASMRSSVSLFRRTSVATNWPASCSVDRGPNTMLAIPGRCIVQAKLSAVRVTPCCSAQSARLATAASACGVKCLAPHESVGETCVRCRMLSEVFAGQQTAR